MSITKTEAADALRSVQLTQARSLEARCYQIGGPQLITWGVAWAAGYGLTGLLPIEAWWKIWLPVNLIAIAVGVTLVRRRPKRPSEAAADTRPLVRGLGAGLILTLFTGGVYTVFQPASPLPYLTFPALLMGAIYAVLGVWRLPRYLWIGSAIFALTLIGFFFFKPWLAFWIAAVGGGGLIAGGLWMRRL